MNICGGPEPRAQRACYGGCYEWCYWSEACATPQGDLTEKMANQIRRFQKRAGGCFPNDLRTSGDFGLSRAMAKMLTEGKHREAGSRNRTARAIERRGLIAWWADDLNDMYNRDLPGHWHVMGEGATFIEKATGERDPLCACVGGAA
ncbi:MAG TPA: hypothetical protein VFM86_07220 [Pedococcus sp.]|nr:hypothetical protein [Pedococcus sp.]